MHSITVSTLIPVLQTAIGPVILISGVGLLLLTMTNRLGRVVDKARALADILSKATATTKPPIREQLRIFWRRARLLRLAITLAALSALFAAILIIIIFLTALANLESGWFMTITFVISMTCLIASLVVFIHDTNQSLTALKAELKLGQALDP
jgi:hypothetical protein